MKEYNNGIGESNAIQNRFTAYLVTAIKRRKQRFLQNKDKGYNNTEEIQDYMEELHYTPDMLDTLPLLAQLEDLVLHKALIKQKERDLYIFFAKVLDERSFTDIAAELGIESAAVKAAYYRMIAKLKKELRGKVL